MSADYATKLVFYLLSSIMSLTIILYFLIKGKKSGLLYSFILFQSLVTLWHIRNLIPLLPNYFLYTDFKKVNYILIYFMMNWFHYIPICFTCVGWLIFCLFFTENKLIRKKYYLVLLPIPAFIAYKSVLNNNNAGIYFDLFHNNITPYVLINLITSYSYFVIGILLLLRHAFKNTGFIKKQSLLLIAVITIPLTFNILKDLRVEYDAIGLSIDIFNEVLLIHGLDVIPVGFTLAMIIIAFATFKYHFLNIKPIALRRLVDNMNQPIIMVDIFNKVIDFNEAFFNILPQNLKHKKQFDIHSFADRLKEFTEKTEENERTVLAVKSADRTNFIGEIDLKLSEEKFYAVNIQPIVVRKDVLGRIIIFNDITEYKKLLKETREKNTELGVLYDKLKEYAAAAEELAVSKERNRFARDVHDTLGHSMTVLLTLLKVSQITCESDTETTKEKISEAMSVAKEGLKELRRSIAGLAPEKLELNSLASAITKLVSDLSTTGINIDLTTEGLEDYRDTLYSGVIFRICQEALTNSIRHGKANNITIIIKKTENMIKLFIMDDGSGCKRIVKGFGLSGMEKRIQDLDGHMEYGSNGESGFNIYAEIPLML